jgi:hypothetical protein
MYRARIEKEIPVDVFVAPLSDAERSVVVASVKSTRPGSKCCFKKSNITGYVNFKIPHGKSTVSNSAEEPTLNTKEAEAFILVE